MVFNSSTLTGTLSSTSDYETGLSSTVAEWHLDAFDTWVTQYVRFAYTKTDMDALISMGELDWNHTKQIKFTTDERGERLPENTMMILVDPNGDADHEYYATASAFYNGERDILLDLTKFEDTEDTLFRQCNFRDLLKGKLTATAAASGGKYRLYDSEYDDLSDAIEATLSDSIVKFIYDDSGSGTHNLAVTDNTTVSEDYYIIIYVPRPDDYNKELFFYSIGVDQSLSGKKSARVVNKDRGYNDKYVLIADLFTQTDQQMTPLTATVVDTATETYPTRVDTTIDTQYNKIYVTAQTVIDVNTSVWRGALNSNVIYHSFKFTLNRHLSGGGVEDTIRGLNNVDVISCTVSEVDGEGTRTVEPKSPAKPNGYYVDVKHGYVNIITGNLKNEINQYYFTDEKHHKIKVEIEFVLDFDKEKLGDEFPSIPQNSLEPIGVNVAATSNIAFESDRLADSSMTDPLPGNRSYFHMTDVATVTLYYHSVSELDKNDYFGEMSQNMSRLGVNGYFADGAAIQYPAVKGDDGPYHLNHMGGMEITAEGTYNVQQVMSVLEDAEQLKLQISLQKKEDYTADGGTPTTRSEIAKSDYGPSLDLTQYFGVKPGETEPTVPTLTVTLWDDEKPPVGPKQVTLIKDANNKYTEAEVTFTKAEWENLDIDTSGVFKIRITFYPITGRDFHEYANYMMTLSAELQKTVEDKKQTINESIAAPDWIVYTNAKVYPSVIHKISSGG